LRAHSARSPRWKESVREHETVHSARARVRNRCRPRRAPRRRVPPSVRGGGCVPRCRCHRVRREGENGGTRARRAGCSRRGRERVIAIQHEHARNGGDGRPHCGGAHGRGRVPSQSQPRNGRHLEARDRRGATFGRVRTCRWFAAHGSVGSRAAGRAWHQCRGRNRSLHVLDAPRCTRRTRECRFAAWTSCR
jgi:hypothetical protein